MRHGERIVRRMYEAFNQPGTLEETLARVEPLLHPDAEYVNPPDAVEPRDAPRESPAGAWCSRASERASGPRPPPSSMSWW